MNLSFKIIFLCFVLFNILFARTSYCPPSGLSERDIAKSVIEFYLSGGRNFYMQYKNICLNQDDFPFIPIEEIYESEVNLGDPEYFVQSKHHFTIVSLKKIKNEDHEYMDSYEVVFNIDAVKEKKKVKLNITINYSIRKNYRSDLSAGCLYDFEPSHLGVVYQECYDSVEAHDKQYGESER